MTAKLSRQKELYDHKAHGIPFKPGDLVWLNNPAVPRGQSKKLHRPWTGPYRVVSRLSEAVYRIQCVHTRRKRLVVHFDRLKPCLPNTRFQSRPSRRSVGASHTVTPPVGTALELVDDPDVPDTQSDHPGTVADSRMSPQSPADPSASSDTAPPSVCTPDLQRPALLHTSRYPHRVRSQPDRYCPVIEH